MNKIAIIFHRFGPYHIARLEAAASRLPILAIELSGNTSEYQWEKIGNSEYLERITLFPQQDTRHLNGRLLFNALIEQLDRHQPTAVAINGWSDKGAFAALYWCIKNNVPAIAMSESSAEDMHRTYWKEAIKRMIVSQLSAGLVGGSRHTNYLIELGIPAECVFTGYDVIDNAYFSFGAEKAVYNAEEERRQLELPNRYFLTSNRFIEKKNLFRLISAYAQYVQTVKKDTWDLVMLGDGELRSQLEELIATLGITERVHLVGFQQYARLPAYYGLASAFIHASTTEQWGLVVNEAMAAGLPVLVSERCGCAPDLVEHAKNGFCFDPYDVTALAKLLINISDPSNDLASMGLYSQQIISAYTPAHFAAGLEKAVNASLSNPRKKSVFSRMLLKALIKY